MKKATADLVPIGQMQDDDREKFIDWVWRLRAINMFDPLMLGYPRTVMCRSLLDGEPNMFIPLQPVLMYDAIAAKPGITPRQEALGLWRIGEAVEKAAQETRFKEVYFFCCDDRVADICAKHGFEELKGVRVLRHRVAPQETALLDSSTEDKHEG